MRDGEIVRNHACRKMVRVVAIHLGTPQFELSDGSRHLLHHISLVTIAELFEAAGCPIPADGYLCQLFGELCVFRDCEPLRDQPCRKRFRLKLFDRLDGEKWEWAADGVFDSTHMIDLSRLPALDAWDALPEVIKAVVK